MKQISQDDLILYALGDLSAADRTVVEQALAADSTTRNELALIQADLAAFALSSELNTPPLLARERLLREVAKEKKLAPTAIAGETTGAEPMLRSRESRVLSMEDAPRRRAMGFFGWAGWAVAAGLAAFAFFQHHRHEQLRQEYTAQSAKLDDASREAERAQRVMDLLTNGGAMQVTLRQTDAAKEPPKPIAHAAYAADTGQLVFVAMHLAALQPDKTYELWVIPADGKAPIPAGLFKPNQQGFASIVLPELPRGVVAAQLGVTIENEGGSQTPTMPIVLAGA